MFETLLIKPLYNGFIGLIDIFPHGDVGLAIIALTILIRIIFYPAFAASIRTQMEMQAVQVDLDEINRKYKDDATERSKRTMALFKEHNIKPFAGLLALIVQIPVFIGLYIAFFREGLPKIATPLLYSFVPSPTDVTTVFFGVLDLTQKHSLTLAFIVAFTQYVAISYSLTRSKNHNLPPEKAAAQAMQQNFMRFGMPALMAFLSYSLPAAAGLYFTTGNLISLGQELIIQRQIQAKKAKIH